MVINHWCKHHLRERVPLVLIARCITVTTLATLWLYLRVMHPTCVERGEDY